MTEDKPILTQGVAVITGAGSGLGQALAIELAGRGVLVAGLGRREAALMQTAAQIPDGRFIAHAADVSDRDAVEAAFSAIAQHGQPITILINNAAIYQHADFLTEDPAPFMRAVGINLGGVVNCSFFALQHMSKAGTGRIINVATFADLAPLSGSAAYSVSKGAARIFTRALVADLGDRLPDIVVSDWIPGALATSMGIPDGIAPADAAKWGATLALCHDRSLNGALFDRDREVLPPLSLKRRIKNAVLFRRRPGARLITATAVQ